MPRPALSLCFSRMLSMCTLTHTQSAEYLPQWLLEHGGMCSGANEGSGLLPPYLIFKQV